MKAIACCVCLSAVVLTAAFAQEQPQPNTAATAPRPLPAGEDSAGRVKFVLELKDGTRLIGVPERGTGFAFQSDFGRFEVPLTLIQAITFLTDHERSRIEFKNGDALTANVVLQSLPFTTSYGTLTVPAEQLVSLTVDEDSAAEGPIVQTDGTAPQGVQVVPAVHRVKIDEAAPPPPAAEPAAEEEEELLGVPDAALLDVPFRKRTTVLR